MSDTSGPQAGRCATADVDLGALAEAYRHRPPSPTALSHADRAVAGVEGGSRVLDIGGGRGHHAARWAENGYRALVLDPGVAMGMSAARRAGVDVVRGVSQRLPFRDNSLAVVYFHLSLHYGDWRAAITEAMRALAPTGVCSVWTLGPHHHRSSMLARWFPSVAAIDSRRFPEPSEVLRTSIALGARATSGEESEEVRRPAGEWLTAVRAGFVSTLQLIEPEELAAGIAAFGSAHPDPEETVAYQLRWNWIRARKADI